MELLILLAEKDGHVVSRQEIIARLWGKDVFVDTEHGINAEGVHPTTAMAAKSRKWPRAEKRPFQQRRGRTHAWHLKNNIPVN